MALSLLVLLVPIALVLGIYQVLFDGSEPAAIDPQPTLAQARAAGAFPVSEPVGLGDGWHPVTAAFQQGDGGRTLRLGYLTPDGRGVQVVQSSVPADRLLPAELADATQPEGAVDVAGTSWQRYRAAAGQRALVLLEPDRTVIVLGSAPEEELRYLVTKLVTSG